MTTLKHISTQFKNRGPVTYRSGTYLSVAIATSLLVVGCVSVSLGGTKTKKASDVTFVQPKAPFKDITLPSADHAWQDKQNGNTISYNSTCNESSDPSIEAAKDDLLSSLEDPKINDHKEGIFDGRESQTTSATGTVDGVRTQVEILVYKKNNCIFSLSYVGVEQNFSQNIAQYREFLQSFKAP
jgi:hypothetical protein